MMIGNNSRLSKNLSMKAEMGGWRRVDRGLRFFEVLQQILFKYFSNSGKWSENFSKGRVIMSSTSRM